MVIKYNHPSQKLKVLEKGAAMQIMLTSSLACNPDPRKLRADRNRIKQKRVIGDGRNKA